MPVAEMLVAGAVAAIAPHLRSAGEALAGGVGAAAAEGPRRSWRWCAGASPRRAGARRRWSGSPRPPTTRRDGRTSPTCFAVCSSGTPGFAPAFERLAGPLVSGDTEMRVDVREGGRVGKIVQVGDVSGGINP